MLAVCLFVIVIVLYYITCFVSLLYVFVTTRLFVRSFSVCTDQDINKWLIGKGVLEATIHFDRSYYYYVVGSCDVAFYYCFLPPPLELCAVVVVLMLSAPLETDHRLAGVMLDAVFWSVCCWYFVLFHSFCIAFLVSSACCHNTAAILRIAFLVSSACCHSAVILRIACFVLLCWGLRK